ncbi:unnamed protein product [Rotaria magnacalcarata]
MSSTTVAQQPLNFGPEWLRALSTPESTTSIPSTSGSGGGGGSVFKFSATKYRYSKDEILALRANVTKRLSEDVRNEIMENLKDIESVFRPNIIEPLSLTTPTAEESAKMNSLSSYISGRTSGGGGGGRGGNNSQQSQQQHDPRSSRGGLVSNGRGGRDHAFGPTRGNNNAEDSGDTGGGDDASGPSSSWSRGGYHSRGGGAFGNRVRSYDDREQPQSFRRGGTRQTSDAWRRSRGDEDENHDQNEDPSTSANGSASSWTYRGGQTRRGGSATGTGGGGGSGGGASMENRTKSNDKWSHTDDRSGSSNSYESNQSRGWRSNAAMSDRDLNSRRPQPKRERIPEWMNDNDNDNQLNSSPFEQDAPFPTASSKRQSNENNEQSKSQTHSSIDDTSTNANVHVTKHKDDNASTLPKTDTNVMNVPKKIEIPEPKPIPPVQQPLASWEDEFEPSDVATIVVEATLAEDHDYSVPASSQKSPHPISIESIQPSVTSVMPQQRVQPSSVLIDDKQWFYKDPQNTVQGPFSSADMERWFAAGYFTGSLPVKRFGEAQFSSIQQLTQELGRIPFRSDGPSIPPVVQQPIVSESQKFNSMIFGASSTANNTYLDDYLLQQQPRQNIQQSLFNRQTSMPLPIVDPKPVTSPTMINPQLQAYFASQQQSQSQSSLFSSNLVNDPAIVYPQQPQLQRSTSATNQQQPLFDELHQHSFRQTPSQSNTSGSSTTSFFGATLSMSQSQKPDDIMTRLAQAMQSHGQQQQEKVEEQRRLDQQRREIDLERLKLAQQAEQLRLQREDEERRQFEQKQKFEEELRKKNEASVNSKNMIFDQMKEMAKTMDQKKQQQQQQPFKSQLQPKVELDPFLAFQQSLQYQKDQQAKIEAQKAENVRRFQQQQQLREHAQQQQQLREHAQQQQQSFKLPETANWARQLSHSDQIQKLNFAEIQKQEQEEERRARDAALAAQQLAKTDNVNIPSSSSSNKPGSWARTLFAGSTHNHNNNNRNNYFSSDQEITEPTSPDSPITSFNQQATNAVLSILNIHPKSRSAASQQSVPWNATSAAPSNTSLQDIQRQQQSQIEPKQPVQQPQPQPQQPTQSSSSGHSTPAWGGAFQQSTPPSSSSIFWGDTQQSSSPPAKSAATSNTKPLTPWTELKSAAASSSSTSKSNLAHAEFSKSEREVKCLFSTTRTQDALSKWTQTQFKDNLQAIDVPTLVQLLKDIDSSDEIIEYVQPYIGSVIKAREFASDFIVKRKQLANAEPELDNERLHELAMAPTSSNSGNGGDEGFQLASNGQKKKAKKTKGQKIDVKQLGFMVNNRPEHRDDIDKVPM